MAAPFATVMEEEIYQMNEEATDTPAYTKFTCLILKQLSPSVSVPQVIYIPQMI